MLRLSYALSRVTTNVSIGDSIISSMGPYEDSLLVYPRSLERMVASTFEDSVERIGIEDGEEAKTIGTVTSILDRLMEGKYRRSSRIISFGGGTVSDVAGFAASLYLRGINYTSVPTTLLSMVDASLGGKNGVNFGGAKNMLGTFYSPSEIIIDTSLVPSMPHNLIEDGTGEIAKYAMIMDKELYGFLMGNTMDGVLADPVKTQYLISRCVGDKMGLVSQDEFDQKGKRIILNYGHTFGHAIEAASQFSIGHGHAVLGGMLLEDSFSLTMGFTGNDTHHALHSLVSHLGFSTREQDYLPGKRNELARFISSDKKSTRDSLKLPLPDGTGVPKVCEVELRSISDYLEHE